MWLNREKLQYWESDITLDKTNSFSWKIIGCSNYPSSLDLKIIRMETNLSWTSCSWVPSRAEFSHPKLIARKSIAIPCIWHHKKFVCIFRFWQFRVWRPFREKNADCRSYTGIKYNFKILYKIIGKWASLVCASQLLSFLEHTVKALYHGCARVAHCVTARWRNFSHYVTMMSDYVFW